MNFDVEKGETWLDLGANIGAFALYAFTRGASMVTCYEPDADNFALLLENLRQTPYKAIQAAVTASPDTALPAFRAKAEGKHSRVTVVAQRHMIDNGTVPNVHGAELRDQHFDGVKMDIEGSEAGLLDHNCLPVCNKLVLEYHTSRDTSAANLKRRLEYLHDRFQRVEYPSDLRKIADSGVDGKTWRDRLIFCADPR
jgi:FkbM family methyltransferase